jgi:NAD(P)-dependent dehydrogenase (short-subunit alcohol dehydrogenase family)
VALCVKLGVLCGYPDWQFLITAKSATLYAKGHKVIESLKKINMNLQLNNKTALITGSTAGIGYATAKQLLQEGANVIINGRTKERVDAAIASLQNENIIGKVIGVAADFSKAEEVNALIAEIPFIDILINNVSIFGPVPFEKITDEEWIRLFEINVLSGIRLSRHYFPLMLQQNWGRIIFISSESAINIPEEMIHYGMTKTAQLAISRGLAELTKKTNVTVNSVLPGPTKSEGVTNFVMIWQNQRVKQLLKWKKSFSKPCAPLQFYKDLRRWMKLRR